MKSQNLGSQERSEAAPESEEPEKMDVDTVEAVEADGFQSRMVWKKRCSRKEIAGTDDKSPTLVHGNFGHAPSLAS